MARKSWKFSVDGIEHEVVFNRAFLLGHNSLFVDGEDYPLPSNLYANYIGYDESIRLGDKEGRLVSLGTWADVVVDGYYISSGKPYLPFVELEWWAWLFVSLCSLVVVYSRGGALPIILVLLGVMFCLQVSVRPELSLLQKLFINLLIVTGVWLLNFIIMNLMLIF